MSRVRVIYRSGSEVEFDCEGFSLTKNALGDLIQVKWEKAKPDPLHFGVDDVAAIWQIK